MQLQDLSFVHWLLCELHFFKHRKANIKYWYGTFTVHSKQNAQQKKENSNYILLSQRKYMINSHMVIHSDELQMYLKRKQMFASD